jgi:DUF971 family protein
MPDDQARELATNNAAHHHGPHDSATTPKDLKVMLEEQQLSIDWLDGSHSEFSFAALRSRCPCATCRAEREQQGDNPLRVLKVDPGSVRVTHAELVGKYAIRFLWSDGHDTGIYDFRLLRELANA